MNAILSILVGAALMACLAAVVVVLNFIGQHYAEVSGWIILVLIGLLAAWVIGDWVRKVWHL